MSKLQPFSEQCRATCLGCSGWPWRAYARKHSNLDRLLYAQKKGAVNLVSLLFALVCLCLTSARAQEKMTEHTLKLSAGQKSPPATIADMAWLAGHWTGDGLGGTSEEIWSAPHNGVMMGMYRHIRNDLPVFYELLTLLEEQGSLIIRLKHFTPKLTGWEEKDKTVDFPFVAKKDGVLHFDGMAFKPEGKDAVTVHLAIHNRQDGSVREAVFNYRRVASLQPITSGVKK